MRKHKADQEPPAEAPAEKLKHFKEQFDDEEVRYVFRKHPVVMRKGLIFSSLALLVGVYVMTTHRFIQQTRSLLQVNVVDISLEQIQMINYQISGLEETMLGFGTIIVQTYAGDLVIHDVHHPATVQKKMILVLRELGIHPTQRPYTNE
jgi:hypothetical protein